MPAFAQEPAPPAAYHTLVPRGGAVIRGTILDLHAGREEDEVVVAVGAPPAPQPSASGSRCWSPG